jgi:hypothetical protein
MRRFTAALAVVSLLVACGPRDDAAPESAGQPAETAAPSIAGLAGTWEQTATLEGTPDPVPSTLHAADSNRWSMDLEGRPGIPLHVSIVGDSVISQSEEYESVLRPGVMVTVRTASVLQDGMLVGNLVATYRTEGGEQVVHGTTRATRIR